MALTTRWDPALYAENARFVSDLGAPLLEILQAQPGELILDLGGGDGALSEKIAAAGAQVIAVDSSIAQLEAAKKRGLVSVAMDGERLALKQRFHAVFSNAALHWMKQLGSVVAGVRASLLARGRFVGEFGGEGNVGQIRIALHEALRRRGIEPQSVDPWNYPSPDEYARLLRERGFVVVYLELIPRPTPLPGDISNWLEVFAQPFTRAVAASDRPAFIAEVVKALEPALRDAGGTWVADYVRLRFKAVAA